MASIAVALGSMGFGVAGATAAGVATLDGTTVRFSDPAGAADRLSVSIDSIPLDRDVDRLGGWRVDFLQYDPATTPGPGCRVGFVAAVCPTGATPPAAVIDVGAGNDEVRMGTDPVIAGQQVTLSLGAGDDKVETYQTVATIDGGPGDDQIVPDDRYSVLTPPPAPSPGGVIRGGEGTDSVDYSNALDPIDVSLDDKPNDGRKGEGDNVFGDVENVSGSQFGGTLIGSQHANALSGGGGDDRIVGGAGADQLEGNSGNDTLDALDGAPNDRVDCGDGADIAWLDAGDIVASADVQGGTPCERMVYAPAIASTNLKYRAKQTAVRLSCPKTSATTCAGTLRLTTRSGKKLAARSYRVARGKRATVALKTRAKPARKATLLIAPKGANPIAGRPVSVR